MKSCYLMISVLLITLAYVNCSSSILSSRYDSKLKKLNKLFTNPKKIDGVEVTSPLKFDELTVLVEKFYPDQDTDEKCFTSESCAKNWMKDYNLVYQRFFESIKSFEFDGDSRNISSNGTEYAKIQYLFNRFDVRTKSHARLFLRNEKKWDAGLIRGLYLISRGIILKTDQDFEQIRRVAFDLENHYMEARICEKNDPKVCYAAKNYTDAVFKRSRNYSELLTTWINMEDAYGTPEVRTLYEQAVNLYNKAARDNKYKDLSEVWLEETEENGFETFMDKLFKDIKPFYDQLHMFVRRRLNTYYGESLRKVDYDSKLIQDHLLARRTGLSWENVFDLVKPYPNVNIYDIDRLLRERDYTPNSLFKEAERFYVSLGLYKMNPTFWKYSVFEKSKSKNSQCYPLSYDFLNGFDFRVKMCTNISEAEYINVHRKMSDVQYSIGSKALQPKFRQVSEVLKNAVSGAISLSVMSPRHLKQIDLIKDDKTSTEQDINYLMKIALKKLPAISMTYTVEKWRNQVLRGEIKSSEYNGKWWDLRNRLQGIQAPVVRTEKNFDVASLYQVTGFRSLSSQFISTILEFQIFEALCDATKQDVALFKCDLSKSRKVGDRLKKLFEYGNKRSWSYVVEKLTGANAVSVESLMDYFKPLNEWLVKENQKNRD